jgi:hypothetical protein
MIILSVEARDDISEDDPYLFDLEPEDGVVWLEVTRCCVRMLSGFSAHWRLGRWWKRTAEATDRGDFVSKDEPSSSGELASIMFAQLSSRTEIVGLDYDVLKDALDEERIAPMALALEVMGS